MSNHEHCWIRIGESGEYQCECGARCGFGPADEKGCCKFVITTPGPSVAWLFAQRAPKRAELAEGFMRDIVRANAAPADGVWQSPTDCAEYAVQCADALLDALEKPRTP